MPYWDGCLVTLETGAMTVTIAARRLAAQRVRETPRRQYWDLVLLFVVLGVAGVFLVGAVVGWRMHLSLIDQKLKSLHANYIYDRTSEHPYGVAFSGIRVDDTVIRQFVESRSPLWKGHIVALSRTRVTENGMTELAVLPDLRSLHLKLDWADPLTKSDWGWLSRFQSLDSLEVDLPQEIAFPVEAVLQLCPQLKILKVNGEAIMRPDARRVT